MGLSQKLKFRHLGPFQAIQLRDGFWERPTRPLHAKPFALHVLGVRAENFLRAPGAGHFGAVLDARHRVVALLGAAVVADLAVAQALRLAAGGAAFVEGEGDALALGAGRSLDLQRGDVGGAQVALIVGAEGAGRRRGARLRPVRGRGRSDQSGEKRRGERDGDQRPHRSSCRWLGEAARILACGAATDVALASRRQRSEGAPMLPGRQAR